MKTPALTLALIAIGMSLAAPAQNLKFGPANAPAGAEQPIDEIGLVINDEAITRRQLAQEIEAERRSVPKGLNLPDAELRQQLLERVIMNHILSQIEKRVGLDISDEEMARRRAEQDAKGWKPAAPRARKVSAALKAYGLLATSADRGAVRDLSKLD